MTLCVHNYNHYTMFITACFNNTLTGDSSSCDNDVCQCKTGYLPPDCCECDTNNFYLPECNREFDMSSDPPWHNKANWTFELGHHYQLHPLNCCSCKFDVSSPYSFWDVSQIVHGLPVLKPYSKRNETLLRTLHVEVCMLDVYDWKYVAPPIESMTAKMLEREHQLALW